MDARSKPLTPRTPVAVIGIGCTFPGAPDVESFWSNVCAGVSGISEVDPARWDPEVFFDADPDAPDRTYSKVGGFIADWRFDGRGFRIPPSTARVMDRAQQYALTAAREAIADAGLDRRPFDRDRTAVILGVGGGRLENEERLVQRVQLPLVERALLEAFDRHGIAADRRGPMLAAVREEYLRGLVDVNEDTFAGLCPNVVAGRVANFLDVHGPSYVVDAACAASLASVDSAVDGLRAGDFDLAVCGGAHAHMGPSFFVAFSKFRGLSTRRVSPFDEAADGFLLGEGAGVLVLKRLDEALRDGDRVRAVIRGVGSSSDGRKKGIGAPNPEAQALAMRRAFEQAGYSPGTVQLLEAHGAGTPVGDPAELQSVHDVFGPCLAPGQRLAITAVKSQVGHLMGAAGAAGLIKTVLGLHHKVMPPTINHTHPSPAIPWETLPFEIVTTPRPWEPNRDGLPRRASVSAFGFGGSNFHLTLEAFDDRWHLPSAQPPAPPLPSREPIAIVGLGACLPKAPDVETFWDNLVGGVSAITDVPQDRWDGQPDLYVDADPDAPDKSHGRVGGFTPRPPVDVRRLRLSPATVTQVDPGQMQLFASALRAIDATQILASPEVRQRTAVIFGDSGGNRELVWSVVARTSARRAEAALRRAARGTGLAEDLAERLGGDLVRTLTGHRPPVTEDTIVGIATSIGPARIAKALDLMGTHMTVDAACGSSLAAVTVAVRGLQSGKWDAVVTGGVGGGVTPHLAIVASKARALSATGSRPFDAGADGFVAGEGAAAFVLKRLSDALAAGDRVYGVIRGVGASTDGRGHSMYAPDSARQALALSRAYADAGLPSASVQYVECHATSTPVGDAAEIDSLRRVFGDRRDGRLGIGSVKAQIGHTMSAAGAAGLLKTVLGLDRKTLPPMPAVASPIDGLASGPFELVTTPAPWPRPADGEPRRGAINAFGFGGTNWHVVVEEFVPEYHRALMARAPALVTTGGAAHVMAAVAPVRDHVFVAAGASHADLLASVGRLAFPDGRHAGSGTSRLAFVARTREQFQAQVDLISTHLHPGRRSPVLDAQGVATSEGLQGERGSVSGLFPGQGAQYADMLRDLAAEYAVVGDTLAEANDVLRDVLGRTYEQLVFTATRSAEERASVEGELSARSDVLQPVLLVAEVALARLLATHAVGLEVVAGHSLGEYAALVTAGALDFRQAVRAAHARGEAFRELAERSGDAGRMAMATAPADAVEGVLRDVSGYVAVANRNCPTQTVISGEEPAVREAVSRLEAQGIECRVLPIAGAFHSRVAEAVRGRMEQAVSALDVRPPSTRVLSSVDLQYYEPGRDCADRVRANLVSQLTTPVDFVGLVARLHADGVRTFIDVGPRHALAGFVADILGASRPHRALFVNHPKFGELAQFDRFVAQCAIIDVGRHVDGSSGVASASPAGGAPVRARTGPTGEPADRLWITGVSVGLPGKAARVFSDEGFDRLLAGSCFIEPVPDVLQDRLVAKRITRLVKTEDGEPHLAEVTSREDSVKLAGQRGAFDLRDDFGLEDEWLANADISYQLAVAAGLESLRDARIPLQRAYKRTSRGGSLRAGWMLPPPLQDDTGVVFASAFPGHNTLYAELGRYYKATHGAVGARALREEYLTRLDAARSEGERLEADQWFVGERRARALDGAGEPYRFNRNFLADYVCMGNARFAQLVRARGPNLMVNAACCSTAAALATAEDMIRCGRARRVVVLAADDVSSDVLFEWIGAGFLAAGAAATDREVAEAALPFDRRRHGMIIGMGAVGFVVESERSARERGLEPVAELLGVRCSNSASHPTRPDADHVAAEVASFLEIMRARHGIEGREIAPNLVYGSHETFTSPSGGIGAVEGRMLKQVFGDHWRDVLVVNTKCATGHAQGASLEDAIIMRALQAGKVPPVLHSTQVDPDLAGINLSKGGPTDREYALRFAAGFGSQVAMWMTRVVTRAADRVTSEERYGAWLEAVTGVPGARVAVVKRVLQVEGAATAEPPARPEARPTAPSPRVTPPAPTTPPPVAAGPAAAAGRAQASRPAPVPAPPPAPPRDVHDRVLAIIEEKTGYERQYLNLDLDLEADLGIDTIKQAQVMARLRETFGLPKDQDLRVKDFPTLRHVVQYVESRTGTPVAAVAAAVPASEAAASAVPPRAPAPAPAAAATAPATATDAHVLDVVLGIIESQTGYERDALELDLDLEADLGIDTIKQAQVMARLREAFDLPREQGLRVKDFPTLRHVVQFVQARLSASTSPAAAPIAAPATPTVPPAAATAPVPAAAPAAPAHDMAASPAGTAVPSTEGRILDVVLGILESQTGYEREALDLDLDLEADLGIDTIKQAQVMARLREAFDLPRDQNLRVKDFPTIRHVVAYVAARVTPAAAPAAAPVLASAMPGTAGIATPDGAPPGICRLGVRWAPLAIEHEPAGVRVSTDWTVLVTDDGLGVAEALADLLRAAGARVEILAAAGDLAAVRSRLGRIRALVLLHALATDPAVAAIDAAAWRGVLDRKVGASFRAIKALKGELEAAVAVTAMAGPYGWRGQLLDPAGAGVAGLIKTLGHEAPTTLVKAIDVERPATRDEAAHVAATVLREIERGGTRTEVAYRDGLRLVPRAVQEPLDLSGAPVRTLGAESVIVAFGGSRGVTAAVVKDLARRCRARLVLVGTRPQPSNIAELAALDADGLKQLKRKIAQGWKARVTGVKPVEIERRYTAVLQSIEAYRTQEACTASGAAASYHACDVRDAAAVRNLVRGVLRQHGRLDGVIFGAGTIEDKLIEDKALESFDRVFGVKAEGIFNVYKALDGVPLTFLAAFSSVAGRFGNAGQADYAAGNEVLARFVGLMQAARPESRCVAIDWTGWDEVGLAARSGVIEFMKQQGFEALSPAEGARFFHEEVAHGRGPEEVVIASMGLPIDRDGQLTAVLHGVPAGPADAARVGVFVEGVTAHAPGAWLTARVRVEPATDRWLSDHVIDGAPLVPAVFGIEMMAEAASLLFPGLHLKGIRDLRLHRAIKVLKGRTVALKVRAVARAGDTDDERMVRVQVLSDFVGPDGRVLVADREHYTGEVLLSLRPPVAGRGDPHALAGVAAETAVPPLYGEGGALPHGPTFRVIERVEGLDGQGVVASVALLDEGRALPSLNGHHLLTMPFAREAAFQSAGLWGILRHGNFGLPHGCRALHHFGTPPPGTRLVVRAVPTVVDPVRIEYDIDVLGDDGRLYDRMEGFYTVNPLAAVARTVDGAAGEDLP